MRKVLLMTVAGLLLTVPAYAASFMVPNAGSLNEELKQETITEALKKSQVINEYVKYQGKLLPFHMFVFEVKKNLLSKNLEG